jgi:hypothetical protein
MFHRVLPSLNGLIQRKKPAAPPIEERRVWVRHPCRMETTVQPTGADPVAALAARVQNISRGGLMLSVDRRIEPGELLSIELPGDDAQARKTVLACVLSVNAEGENEWTLSCSFSVELSEGDLRLFGVQASPAGESEQRTLVRYACKANCVYEIIGSAERGQADVQDLSVGGMALATATSIPVGSLLNLWLRDENDCPIATMLASVVSARSAPDGSCTLGCTFLGELSESQLRDLA